MRIIFLLVAHGNPFSGGMNVLKEHMRILKNANFDIGFCCYNQEGYGAIHQHIDPVYSHVWPTEFQTNDLIVIPEEFIWFAFSDVIPRNLQYVIFSQGVSAMFNSGNENYQEHKSAYEYALARMSNSHHTTVGINKLFDIPFSYIFECRIGIDSKLFYPEEKTKTACYLTYKNGEFARFIDIYFRGKYPDWELIKIDRAPKEEMAKIFRKSKLFLNFGGPEGFGLPPLEAAFCNCKVIGFDGSGGSEFFKEPTFTSVKFKDHLDFIEKLDNNIKNVDTWSYKEIEYIDHLRQVYSLEKQTESVLQFYNYLKSKYFTD